MLVLCLAALLATAFAQQQCSFSDPQSGYSLSWTTNNGQINFNLTYRNFPTNSYTGVGFGDSMAAGIDAILVSVLGSTVQVNPAYLNGYNPPNLLNDRSVSTQSASYRDNMVQAQFSRPVSLTSNNHKSLSGCNMWNFITSPGGYRNGQYTKHQNKPQQQRMCNVDTMCQQGSQNMMNMMSSSNMNNMGYQNMQNNNQMYNNPQQQNNMNNRIMDPGMQGQQWGQPMGQGYNNQQQPFGMNPQYQPIGVPNMPSNQFGQGQNFGYQPNTGTPPPLQPYTGQPFVYTTTMDPTWGNSGNSQQQYRQNNMPTPQQNPSNQGQNNQMPYNSGSGAYPNNNLNNPYQQQPYGTGQGVMYDPSAVQGNYNGYYSSSNQQQNTNQRNQQQHGRKRRSIRAKRQTSGYQPTNNIYGYDYNNSGSSSVTTAPIVVNPNYRYLSGPLADDYSRNYATEVRAYDQQQQGFGNNNFNLNGNAPALNNDQQNQRNFQQIQQDYSRNPNPTQNQVYTNNIYGYNYGGSSFTSTPSPNYSNNNNAFYNPSSYNGQIQRDQPSNPNLFYPANPNSPTPAPFISGGFNNPQFDPTFGTGVYQSGSNLKGTTLRDPTQYQNQYVNGVARDYIPGTSAQTPFEYTYYDPNTSLYYPFRTTTNFQPFSSTFYDDNGIVRSSYNPQQVQYNPPNRVPGVQFDSNNQFGGGNPCSLQDPYWCQDYVTVYLSSQQKYNYVTQPMACQQLRQSLTDTFNGCCNTVRAAGC